MATFKQDPEAVVCKVSETVGSSLNEFHLAVEPFRDSVVPRKAPHTDDGYKPLTERIGQAAPYGMSRVPQLIDHLD